MRGWWGESGAARPYVCKKRSPNQTGIRRYKAKRLSFASVTLMRCKASSITRPLLGACVPSQRCLCPEMRLMEREGCVMMPVTLIDLNQRGCLTQ